MTCSFFSSAKNLLVIIFLIAGELSFAQTLIVGTVKDIENVPLEFATVELKNHSDSVVAYDIVEATGRFSVEINELGKFHLHARLVGYESHTIPIFIFQLSTDTIYYDVKLNYSSFNLEEIEVVGKRKAIIIAGDSIIYNPDSFAQLQDESLTEVLERMPGVSIKEGGKIYINNEPIDELLINGNKISENQIAITQGIAPITVDKIKLKK
ncbi:MAG: carboxypeptidase regulatory-like domain-containing protein [Calothrix sp. SM1_7_51]|nr:carboxypeptidase regulatory-like domain-containing protein [Calothrix sp. SM1_7_51]